MSVESVVSYIVDHNIAIIEGLIAGILLVVLVWGYKILKSPPDESPAGAPQLGDLEETLKKLLEKASALPAAAAGAAGGSAENGELLLEIEMLKKSLQERQAEIDSLKVPGTGATPASGGSLSDEDKLKFEAQIKELSGKLAEYEIISEDIADLSFYKEENARLAKQLEAKGGAPEAAAPAPAAAKPAEPAPAAVAAVADPAPGAVAPTPAAAAKPEPEIVGRSKTKEAAAAPAEPAAQAAAEDEIMAEFSQAVADQKPAATAAPAPAAAEDPGMDLGNMDMEKMMAEATTIQDAPAAEVENALETGLDESKLLEEASALQGETGNVKSEDKELMNEFENFVKKGS